MEDVFGKLPKDSKEINFVEEFYSLRQKFSHCVSMYKKLYDLFLITCLENRINPYQIVSEDLYSPLLF